MNVAWTEDELNRIGQAQELRISTQRLDGSLRPSIPIWQVRVGDAIFIRSAHGVEGSWFRRAVRSRRGQISSGGVEKPVSFALAADDLSDQITAAYHAKYDRYGPGPVGAVTGSDVRETTLQVLPAGE